VNRPDLSCNILFTVAAGNRFGQDGTASTSTPEVRKTWQEARLRSMPVRGFKSGSWCCGRGCCAVHTPRDPPRTALGARFPLSAFRVAAALRQRCPVTFLLPKQMISTQDCAPRHLLLLHRRVSRLGLYIKKALWPGKVPSGSSLKHTLIDTTPHTILNYLFDTTW
jgi:hypothetical protein